MHPWKSPSPMLLIVNGLTLSRLPAGVLLTVCSSSPTGTDCVYAIVAYMFGTDLLDGKLARRFHATTRAGGILDYVVDRFNFYLVISVLVRQGVPPLLFLPFFLRDLVYIAVQTYIALPLLRGTKAASFAGTAIVYIYLMAQAQWHIHRNILDVVLVVALLASLANLGLRVYRVRHQLLAEFAADLER